MKPARAHPDKVAAQVEDASRAQAVGLTDDAADRLRPKMQLHGTVSVAARPGEIAGQIDLLTEEALRASDEMAVLEAASKKHGGLPRKFMALAKDSLNYVLMFRGDSPSSEGGDVILDEQSKLKSRSSAEYLRQRHADEMHLEIVSTVVQMAMGLGMQDREEGKQETQAGFDRLSELVGRERAQATLDYLTVLRDELEMTGPPASRTVWTISERRRKLRRIMEASTETDAVIKEIKDRIHRYNHRSKLALGTSRVVKTTLSVVSLTPTLVGPAAQVALFGYVMATGGTEEDKLLKELYLDKRLDSRGRVISEKAHLALENYQVAALTGNAVLLSTCESLLKQMVGPDRVAEVVGGSAASTRRKNRPAAAPPLLETEEVPAAGSEPAAAAGDASGGA